MNYSLNLNFHIDEKRKAPIGKSSASPKVNVHALLKLIKENKEIEDQIKVDAEHVALDRQV